LGSLNHAIGLAYQVNENILISGDLNSDLMSLNNNKLIDMMRLFNLTNVIEKPTRVTNHSRTLLDPIIASDTINYVFSDVEVILQKPCNTHSHEYLKKPLLLLHYKYKAQFQCLPQFTRKKTQATQVMHVCGKIYHEL
jgi:hypothetical protein